MEERDFITKGVYQTKMENKVKCNTPLMMAVNTKIWQMDRVNVVQTSESRIKHNYHPILLLREHVWSRFGQSIAQHYRLTINHYNFCIQEDHSFKDCSFIKWDVQDAMIDHFHIQAENNQNLEDDHNLLAILQNVVLAT
jgi:hypothetical protein